jgi:bifunctional non-homologous end joining protein LigD
VPYSRPKAPAGGVKANYPAFIEPALASSIEKVPAGERWIHEIKFDGYRVQVHLRDAAVTVFTRRGNDWTKRFAKVAADAWHVNAGSAIIDGEIVVPAADGTTDFSVLQNELKGKSTKIVMVAFDLLYLNGYDLRKLPLVERNAVLKKLRRHYSESINSFHEKCNSKKEAEEAARRMLAEKAQFFSAEHSVEASVVCDLEWYEPG